MPDTEPNSGWWKLLIGVVVPLLIAGIAAYATLYRPKEAPAKLTPTPIRETSETTYRGLVRTKDGRPLAGAHVEAALDGQVPQSFITDSEGIFHLRVPSSSSSLHLSINLEGFRLLDRDAEPHRTDLEILEMDPVAKQRTSSPTPKPQHPVPITNNIAPGGFAVSGGYLDHPTVNNAPPPAKVMWAANPDDRIGKGGTAIKIEVDHTLENPSFNITCDRPCTFQGIGSGTMGMAVTGDIKSVTPQILFVSMAAPRPLGPGGYFLIFVTSTDGSVPRVLQVDKSE